jgi:hypothetical protein
MKGHCKVCNTDLVTGTNEDGEFAYCECNVCMASEEDDYEGQCPEVKHGCWDYMNMMIEDGYWEIEGELRDDVMSTKES